MIKRLFPLMAVLLLYISLSAQTNFVEGFDLNIGSLNNQNQWQGNTDFQVVSDAMTLADYPQTNSEAKVLRVQSSGGNIARGNLLPTSFTTGAAYLSFLIRIDNQGELPTAPALQLGLEKATFTNTFTGFSFYEHPVTGNIEAALTTQSALDEVVTSGGGFTVGTVYHVVLKYEFLAAANDALAVFISPTFMATEPASPILQTTVNGTGLADEIGRLLVDAPAGSSNMLAVDGIQFGNAWNGTFDLGLLPVELAGFRATPRTDHNELSWRTLTESNNELFRIQRSTDGRVFTSIGEVPGFGDSHQPIAYRFEDRNPPLGIAYYRLVQQDYSGATSNSEIITVENKQETLTVNIYPNPTSDYLRVDGPGLVTTPVQLRVRRSDGGMTPIQVATVDGSVAIDVRNWPAGTYVLEMVMEKGERAAYPFVVK